MYKQIIESRRKDIEKSIEHLKEEMGKMRTGRASPAIVENLMINYYGTKTPLKQVASINIPEPRLILIQPWNQDFLANIEAAIKESDLGINPNNDGQAIRLNIPALTEERREEMVKALNKKTEETRVSVRNVREEIWKEIQDLEKKGKISEDDKFNGKDDLQKVMDEYNGIIEGIREKKEKETMTV